MIFRFSKLNNNDQNQKTINAKNSFGKKLTIVAVYLLIAESLVATSFALHFKMVLLKKCHRIHTYW